MKGDIIFNGVSLTEDERYTISILVDKGYSISLVPRSEIKGFHLPDVVIEGKLWEIKSPKGKGKNTIRHNLQRAEKQSENVIIDLHRCGIPDDQAISQLKYEFSRLVGVRKLKIITKKKEILDFSK